MNEKGIEGRQVVGIGAWMYAWREGRPEGPVQHPHQHAMADLLRTARWTGRRFDRPNCGLPL